MALAWACLGAHIMAAQEGRAVACPSGRTVAPVIDSVQLMRDLAVLAADSMEGRRFGTAGSARARSYLLERLHDIGVDSLPEGWLQPVPAAGDGPGGANVMGLLRGRNPSAAAIVLTAHYDHLGTRDGEVFNGADDNASGTAGVLAIAAWLRRHPPVHPVLLVLFDGEERGLRGSRAFLAASPWPPDRMLININLDMVSRSERGELYAVGPGHRPALRAVVEQAACAAEVSLMLGHDKGSRDDWTSQSDQGPFHAHGVPFLYFGVEDHQDYHRATDEVTQIDPGFYLRAVRTIAAALVQVDGDPAPAAR